MALTRKDAATPRDTSSTQTLPASDDEVDRVDLTTRGGQPLPDEDRRRSSRPNPARSTWDKIVSGAGAVVAITLIVLGGVRRLRRQLRPGQRAGSLGAAEHHVPAVRGHDAGGASRTSAAFAGQQVATGAQAEAFSRYIGGHLAAVNGGDDVLRRRVPQARAEGLDPGRRRRASAGKADTLFKGETLRSMLLNAYGWWTVATIALVAGCAHDRGWGSCC